ncbi:MAG: EamA family transporter [Actinobacteria bacterium]|nr:EamA family transporter [Actinomycetota bacterium]
MAVLLGLVAAGAFGAADFLGGLLSRRSPATAVLIPVQVTGLTLALVLAFADDTPVPAGSDLGLAMAGGVVGMTSLGVLYQALASGRMGVVAPVSAVLTAVLPVAWALLHGERPSSLAFIGVALAVVAVALVAREPETVEALGHGVARPVLLAAGAGVGFGVVVIVFSEVADGSGFWPLVFVRLGGVSVVGGALLATRRLTLPRRADRPAVLLAGVLDLTGNAAIIQGFREGLTSIVAPVGALFPAATVLLARVVLDERLTRTQLAGLAVALAGLVLIGAG